MLLHAVPSLGRLGSAQGARALVAIIQPTQQFYMFNKWTKCSTHIACSLIQSCSSQQLFKAFQAATRRSCPEK